KPSRDSRKAIAAARRLIGSSRLVPPPDRPRSLIFGENLANCVDALSSESRDSEPGEGALHPQPEGLAAAPARHVDVVECQKHRSAVPGAEAAQPADQHGAYPGAHDQR